MHKPKFMFPVPYSTVWLKAKPSPRGTSVSFEITLSFGQQLAVGMIDRLNQSQIIDYAGRYRTNLLAATPNQISPTVAK